MAFKTSVIKNTIIGGIAVIFFSFLLLRNGRNPLERNFRDEDSSYRDVEEKLLLNSRRPLFCETCALVGTAGTLLNSSLGQAIDNFQCVFRLGFSPVLGMERDLGSKTTIRVVDAFRFYPFLKRPAKLLFGKYKSHQWYLFDKMPGDELKYQEYFVDFLKMHGKTSLHWFTKDKETEVIQSLKKLGGAKQYSLWNGRPTALWFTIKVIEEAGCPILRIYGIPDPKICKKKLNVEIRSKYWDNNSLPLCHHGVDANSIEDLRNLTASSETVSILERRALKVWASSRQGVKFKKPSWPSRKEELHVEKSAK